MKIYNNDLSVLNSKSLQFSVSLSLTNSGTFSGTTNKNSASGEVSFDSLYITSAGTFKIEAQASDMVTATSSDITILPYSLYEIQVSSSSPVSCNFDFTLTIKLYDQKSELWTSDTSLTLTTSTSLYGELTKTISSGQGTSTVYSTAVGDNLITLQSGSITTTITVTILKNSLRIDSISPTVIPTQPTLTNSIFSVTVKVYDNSLTTVESTRGPYTIALSLSTGTLVGSASLVSSSGTATFTNLKITTSGNHQLLATCSTMNEDYSDTLTIDDLGLASLSISIDRLIESANTDFIVSISLKDQSGGTWTSPCSVTLTSDGSLEGSTTGTASGSLALTVYSTSTGNLTITASSGSKSASSSIEILPNSLKIESINPTVIFKQPTLTTTSFSVQVCVYNNDLTSKIEAYGPFDITLALTSAGTLSGTLTVSSTSGCADFASLQILTYGSYYIRASSPSMNSKDSALIVIKDLTVTLSASNPSPTCFFDFSLNIVVQDETSAYYSESLSISLTAGDSVFATNPLTTATGQSSVQVYFILSGSKTIVATTLGYSKSLVLTVSKAIIKIVSITPTVTYTQPVHTESLFSAKIQVQDSSSTIETSHGPHSISLSIKSSNDLLASGSSTSGTVEFSSLKITLTGSQQLVASCSDMISAESSIFNIAELVLTTIEITLNTNSPSVNHDFEVFIKLYDQRPVLWAYSAYITLTGSLNIVGSTSQTIYSGSTSFIIYATESGSLTLTATSGSVASSVVVKVLVQKLNFIDLPPVKVKRFEKFSFSVGVYDNSLSSIEGNRGPYLIKMTIDPDSFVFGNLNVESVNGVSVFADLAIAEIGNHLLLLASSGIESVYSGLVQVVYNYVVSVTVTVGTYTPMAKYYYKYPVLVMNETSSSPLTNVIITLTANSTFIANLTTDSAGYAYFQLVYNVSGEITLTFTCDISSQSETLSVQVSNNTDPLCIVAESSTTCDICVQNSNPINGTCTCYPGSTYSSTTQTCECPPGQSLSRQSCIPCGNYFDPSEISSSYSEDYLSIQIQFTREVNTLNLNQCSDIIKGPAYFTQLQITCTWLSAILLQIKLQDYPDLHYSQIELQSSKVKAKGETCNYNLKDLLVDIYRIFPVPTPTSAISAPALYSLTCCDKNLTVYASTVSKAVVYTWTVKIDPANEKIQEIVNATQGYYLDIPREVLAPCLIEIELKTQFKNLATWAKSQVSVTVTDERTMMVELNVGREGKVRTDQTMDVIAFVSDNCGSDSKGYEYEWTTQSLGIFIEDFLLASRPDVVRIKPYSLKPGHSYMFTVKITDGETSGSASTTISVAYSDLVIQLSRSSGSISPDLDLVITSQVTDPDDPNSEIYKLWTCSEHEEVCLDSSSNPLVLEQQEGNLTVSNLRDKALYRFSLKAYTSSKTAYAVLLIYVDPETFGTIEIPSSFNTNEKIDPDYVFNVLPKFNLSSESQFQWKINGSAVDGKFSSDSSFIGFLEGALTSVDNFDLSLTVQSIKFAGEIETHMQVTVNKAPECQGTSYEIVNERWALTSILCVDQDDSDYPLTYQFGFIDSKEETVWLGQPLEIFKSFLLIPENSEKICVRVCDSLSTCRVFYNKIESRRRRTEQVQVEEIEKLAKDFLKIPNLIIYYSGLDLSDSAFLYLFGLMQEYFMQVQMTGYVLEVYISCIEHMMKVENEKVLLYENLTDLSFLVLGNVTKRLSDSNVLRFVKVFDDYVSFIETGNLLDMLNKLSDVWTLDLTPPWSLKYKGKISLYWGKMNGAYFPGSVLEGDGIVVEVNRDNDYSYHHMYDIVVFIIETNTSVVISVSHKDSADYNNYYLLMHDTEDSKIKPSHDIRISFEYQFKTSSIKCSGDKSSCSLAKVNNSHVVVDISGFGVFSIENENFNCSFLRIPIVACALICIFFIIYGIVVYKNDMKFRYDHVKNRQFWVLFGISSLFIPQHNPRRLMAISEIAAVLNLLIGLIGFSFDYLDRTFDSLSIDFGAFTIEQLSQGLFSLGLLQVISISNLVARSHMTSSNTVRYLIFLTNVIFIVVGFSLTVMACMLLCPSTLDIWLITFAIFSFLQLFILQPLFSIIPALLIKRLVYKATRVTSISKDFPSPSKDISIYSYSPDARVSTKPASSQDRTTLFRF